LKVAPGRFTRRITSRRLVFQNDADPTLKTAQACHAGA